MSKLHPKSPNPKSNNGENQVKSGDSAELKIIFLTVFIYLIGFGMVLPLIPMISREFGASPIATGWLLSIYSIMQFIFSPLWGRLSDRIGRRPILLFCLAGEVVAYIIFAFSKNLEMLFISRALSGFFGASISTASAYISDITPSSGRTKGMALIGAAFGLGFVLGPAIGGGLSLLAQKNGNTSPYLALQMVGLTVALFCLGTFIFALLRLREPARRHEVDRVTSRWTRIKGYIFKRPVNIPLIVYLLVGVGMAAMEATLVLYMADYFDWGLKETSFGFAYVGLSMAFTQGFLVRKLVPKWGEAKILTFSLILFAIGMAGIPATSYLLVIGLSMTLLAVGIGLSNSSLLGVISLLSPSDSQGEALGVAQSFSSLGRILGPLIGGFLYSIYNPGPFIFAAVIGLLCWILIILNKSIIPQSGKVESAVNS
ncbi:MAG: MFS transporter [Bdellovibrionota bacterium]